MAGFAVSWERLQRVYDYYRWFEMYTNYKYTVKEVLIWTRHETLVFLALATLMTALYELLGLHWLQIPWTPLALVGTAVAFLIGFQNNAAYGRAWEARKIWGGIVNTSRTFAMMTHDLITNQHADQAASDEELSEQRTRLIHRHLAWLTALRFAMRTKKPWESFSDQRTGKEWYEKVCIPERDNKLEDVLAPLLDEQEYKRVMEKTNKPAAILALDGAMRWKRSAKRHKALSNELQCFNEENRFRTAGSGLRSCIQRRRASRC